MTLKLWTYDRQDGDYFVAESAEEAGEMFEKFMGYPLSEVTGDTEAKWESLPDDKAFAITFEDPTLGLPEGRHEMSAAAWCALAGPGYLASKNW